RGRETSSRTDPHEPRRPPGPAGGSTACRRGASADVARSRPDAKRTGDGVTRDPIWDREVETETHSEAFARASAAWEKQLRHLMDHSRFYQRKFRDAGITQPKLPLTEIGSLPFSTKDELKGGIDEMPPFGSNLCVAAEHVKRVYQTSGTTGAPSVLALTHTDMET